MRQSLPFVRTVVPCAGDREYRQDHHVGVLSVPRLPGGILRRQTLSTAGARRQVTAPAEAGCRRGRECLKATRAVSRPDFYDAVPRLRHDLESPVCAETGRSARIVPSGDSVDFSENQNAGLRRLLLRTALP